MLANLVSEQIKNNQTDKNKTIAIALYDYDAVTEEELNFDEGDEFEILNYDDPEWFLVRRLVPYADEPSEGYIPKSYCKYDHSLDNKSTEVPTTPADHSQAQSPITPKSPNKLKDIVNKQMKITTAEVLKAFGAMPSGFRPATLTAYQLTNRQALLSTALFPTFEANGYRFRDMKMKMPDRKMTPVATRFNLAFTVTEAKNVPLIGSGISVYGRYINISLFDKTKIIGNVQTISAFTDPKNERCWRFSQKKTLFPSDDESSCLVRVDEYGPDIGVLFELVIVIARKVADGGVETQHISCGWAVLPIMGVDGKPLESKTFEMRLFGGTIYEKDVPLEDLIENRPSRSLWQNLRNTIRSPQLEIKVWKINSKLLEDINYLPPSFTFLLKNIRVLVMLRKIMYQMFVHEKEIPVMKSSYSPSLAIALKICDEADMLKSLSNTWETKWMNMKRSDKKDDEIVKKQFFETVAAFWPGLVSFNTPKFMNGHQGRLDDRSLVISQYLSDGPLKTFGQNPSNVTFAPFDIEEVSLNPLERLVLSTK